MHNACRAVCSLQDRLHNARPSGQCKAVCSLQGRLHNAPASPKHSAMVQWQPPLVWRSASQLCSRRVGGENHQRRCPARHHNALMSKPFRIVDLVGNFATGHAVSELEKNCNVAKQWPEVLYGHADDPPAAPRRAVRRFLQSNSGSRLICSSGSHASNSASRGRRGKAGRREGACVLTVTNAAEQLLGAAAPRPRRFTRNGQQPSQQIRVSLAR